MILEASQSSRFNFESIRPFFEFAGFDRLDPPVLEVRRSTPRWGAFCNSIESPGIECQKCKLNDLLDIEAVTMKTLDEFVEHLRAAHPTILVDCVR